MSCGCSKPDRTNLWSAIPEFRQPTEIAKGENIDCYAKRAYTSGKNDVAEKIENRIDNTSLVSDLTGKVDAQFKLTPGSTKVASSWTIKIDGAEGLGQLSELTFIGGKLSGQVAQTHLNKNYKVLITASDGDGDIDAREFNFFPKNNQTDLAKAKEETVRFVFPYSPNTGRITCQFGPRKPPATGASSLHKGIDISAPGATIGFILSAADGTVVQAGPARGFGNWIVIEHRDAKNTLVATTVYGHMNELYVKKGDKVAAGQKIAKEGNAGIGTAAHLHFELHKGSHGNPVDPVPYINGNFAIAENNLPGQEGIPDETSFANVQNSQRGLTSAETTNTGDCPDTLPEQTERTQPTDDIAPDGYNNKAATRSSCAPATTPSTSTVKSEMQRAFAEHPELSSDDISFLKNVAFIESSLDPFAKNPKTSATGLFQMVDKLAATYYTKLNISPTCENRCNPYYATKAQILWYKTEFKKYWNLFESSGRTKIGKKIKQTTWSQQYSQLTQNEFMYMIHHDGVGSVENGVDLGGLKYWRDKTNKA